MSRSRDAVQAGLGLAHLGAQVSFTGALIENLNALEAGGVNSDLNHDGHVDLADFALFQRSIGTPE
jgi:hypothetical protein